MSVGTHTNPDFRICFWEIDPRIAFLQGVFETYSLSHPLTELNCELLSKNLRSLLLAADPTTFKCVCLQWLGTSLYFLEHGGQAYARQMKKRTSSRNAGVLSILTSMIA